MEGDQGDFETDGDQHQQSTADHRHGDSGLGEPGLENFGDIVELHRTAQAIDHRGPHSEEPGGHRPQGKVLDGRFVGSPGIVQGDQGIEGQGGGLQTDEDQDQVVGSHHKLEACHHEEEEGEILGVGVFVEALAGQCQGDKEHRGQQDQQLGDYCDTVHEHYIKEAPLIEPQAQGRSEVHEQHQDREHDIDTLVQILLQEVDNQNQQRAANRHQHGREGGQIERRQANGNRLQHYWTSLLGLLTWIISLASGV